MTQWTNPKQQLPESNMLVWVKVDYGDSIGVSVAEYDIDGFVMLQRADEHPRVDYTFESYGWSVTGWQHMKRPEI